MLFPDHAFNPAPGHSFEDNDVTQSRGPFVSTVSYCLIAAAALAVVGLAASGAAMADDDFPLAEKYTQNVPCKGDGSDPKDVQVEVSPQQIVSNMGVCTILN